MKTNTIEIENIENKIDKLSDLYNQFNQIFEVVENLEDETFSIRDFEGMFFNIETKDAYFELLCSFSETIISDELLELCFRKMENLTDEMYELEERRDALSDVIDNLSKEVDLCSNKLSDIPVEENNNSKKVILINKKADLEDEINLISTEMNNRKIFIESDNKFSDISSKELKKMVSKLNQDIQKISKDIKAL